MYAPKNLHMPAHVQCQAELCDRIIKVLQVKKQARIIVKMADHGNKCYVLGCAGDVDFSYPSHRQEMSTGEVDVYL